MRVPNERFAQTAKVSYDKIMDMFFNACNVDWEAEHEKWDPVCAELNKGKDFRIVGNGTDLRMNMEGHNWRPTEGKVNVPDGEIGSWPNWQTVNGYITFDFPATIGGKIIKNLRLEFENGVCIGVSADNDVDYVNGILDSDEGARRVGEWSFGTNFGIDVVTTDILIDEKFGGTMHIAMGRPYDYSYDSAIHWDIVKDLRRDSKVYMDGKLIFENGRFLFFD